MTYTGEIVMRGDLDAPALVPWVQGHAAKLGVALTQIAPTAARLSMTARGPEEMVQALAVGCHLGPHGVLVDDVTLSPQNARPPQK